MVKVMQADYELGQGDSPSHSDNADIIHGRNITCNSSDTAIGGAPRDVRGRPIPVFATALRVCSNCFVTIQKKPLPCITGTEHFKATPRAGNQICTMIMIHYRHENVLQEI